MTATYTPRHAGPDREYHELMVGLAQGPSASCPRCSHEGRHARREVTALPALRVVEGGAA